MGADAECAGAAEAERVDEESLGKLILLPRLPRALEIGESSLSEGLGKLEKKIGNISRVS